MGTFPVKCRHHASMASLPVRAPLTASLVRNGSIRDPIGISSRLGNSFNSRRRPPATTCFGTQATPAALVPNSLETSAGSEYQTRGAAFRSQADGPSHTTYPHRIAETAILLLFREYGRRGSESNRRPRLCSPLHSHTDQCDAFVTTQLATCNRESRVTQDSPRACLSHVSFLHSGARGGPILARSESRLKSIPTLPARCLLTQFGCGDIVVATRNAMALPECRHHFDLRSDRLHDLLDTVAGVSLSLRYQ